MNFTEKVVSVEDAQVKHLGHIIFDQLRFSVGRGEHLALVGKSGSGKSALLNVIAGKLPVSRGSIVYPALLHPPQHHQQIALVGSRHHFQNRSNTRMFYYQQRFNASESEDANTVEEYLSKLSSVKTGYWTLERVMERLRLIDLRGKHLIKLSNGETKRLLIASALLRNPKLFLLDHPLSGLDMATRDDFDGLLSEVAKGGATVIMATSPLEVPKLIQKVALLDDGGAITMLDRKAFDAVRFDPIRPVVVDRDELKQLLSVRPFPDFTYAIKMEGVQVRYREKQILQAIDWEVKGGERWALLGPNGAGKSTLLSLINGDNPQAYANRIFLFDQRRGSGESIWDIKRKVGFVSPELFQYFPSRQSCLEVIESGFYDTLGLFTPSQPEMAGLARRWMLLLGMEREMDRLFGQVSASVQRLCLLARALIKNPPLLVLDEPGQGLDEVQKLRFKTLVELVCEFCSVTIIYVSHYPNEIPASVNRRIELKEGRIDRIV
jgi:molybdate transport system ATP-binding protein